MKCYVCALIEMPNDLVECRKKCSLDQGVWIGDCEPWWHDLYKHEWTLHERNDGSDGEPLRTVRAISQRLSHRHTVFS